LAATAGLGGGAAGLAAVLGGTAGADLATLFDDVLGEGF
jgi:hypothetical protein